MKLDNPNLPQVKVLALGLLVAVLNAANDLLGESGLDWRTVARSLIGAAITVLVGYFVPETNPSKSAIEVIARKVNKAPASDAG